MGCTEKFCSIRIRDEQKYYYGVVVLNSFTLGVIGLGGPTTPGGVVRIAERPRPGGRIAGPPGAARRPNGPKYGENGRPGAVSGQTGSGNMAATR